MSKAKSAGKASAAMLDGKGLRFVVVVARFNSNITYKMRDLCVERLRELGVRESDITVVEVPGSFELPATMKRRVCGTNVSAAIAIGAVIRGETDHYEFIARSAADGLQQVAVECGKPVIFGVLTTDSVAQAKKRTNNATTYAENAVEMANVFSNRIG